MSFITKLFVGGLPYSTTQTDLENLFSPFGTLASAAIVTDKFTGRSKGFGFIEMESDEEAQKAIDALNNTEFGGRTINVSVARPKEDRPGRDNFQRGGYQGQGGGNGGGGFNRGSSPRRDFRR